MARLMRFNLENVGFRVFVVENDEMAISEIQSRKVPDVIVMDFSTLSCSTSVMDFCSKLKEIGDARHIPIIVISARSDVLERIRCLETCVDDFLIKPFIPAELVARVRSVLRRSRRSLAQDIMRVGDLTMNMGSMQVVVCGVPIHLSIKEFKLLQRFMEYPGRVYSRKQLLSLVWDHPEGVDVRTIDVHINRLRVALQEAGEAHGIRSFIKTVRGSGYCLNVMDLEVKVSGGTDEDSWNSQSETVSA